MDLKKDAKDKLSPSPSQDPQRERVSLKIYVFQETEPATILVDPEWTVGRLEAQLAKVVYRCSPDTFRFAVNGQLLQKTTKIKDLPSRILKGSQVIDILREVCTCGADGLQLSFKSLCSRDVISSTGTNS